MLWHAKPSCACCAGAKQDECADGEEPGSEFLVDALDTLTGTAALIIIIALARRVPLMR